MMINGLRTFLSVILILVLASSLFLSACTKAPKDTPTESASGFEEPSSSTENEAENKAALLESHKEFAKQLDGKRVLFIGNSYLYYGQMVRSGSFTNQTVAMREHDDGLFYELLHTLGAEVDVVNWVFGSHQMEDFFTDSCKRGKDCSGENHMEKLQGEAFDYVVFQICGREFDTGFLSYLEIAVNMFRETNPNTEFIYIYNAAAYGINGFAQGVYLEDAVKAKPEIMKLGIKVVDWGRLVTDIIYGKRQVPNSSIPYSQDSFIVAKSEVDGYHPNQLTGFICTAMVYLAMTGDSAIGLPYEIVGNGDINTKNDMKNYIRTYYTFRKTNYDQILNSKDDMESILALIDEYMSY